MGVNVTAQYAALHKRADWRALTNEMPWTEHQYVVIGQSAAPGATRPRSQAYDVFANGQLVATRQSLREAKAVIDDKYGAQEWKSSKTDPIEVDHYYFGPTTEFSSPNTYWYA